LSQTVIDYIITKAQIVGATATRVDCRFGKVGLAKAITNLQASDLISFEEINKLDSLGLDIKWFNTEAAASILQPKIVERFKEEAAVYESSFPVDNYELLICVETRREVVYCPSTSKITPIDPDYFSTQFLNTKGEPLRPQAAKATYGTPCVLRYSPNNTDRVLGEVSHGMSTCEIYNTYQAPEWLSQIDSTVTECPGDILDILKNLIPDASQRDYFFNWVYTALKGKNETILVLNGAKGTGKGRIIDLMRNLVGMSNFSKAPQSAAKSAFNSYLKDKKLVVFDEVRFRSEELNKLKDYANNLFSVEGKGLDAVTMESFNNYIIANNTSAELPLKFDERRYSVLDLGSTNLLELYGTDIDKKDRIFRAIADGDYSAEFGSFILNRGIVGTFNVGAAFKGERFHEIVYDNLSEWQKFIIESFVEGKEYVEFSKIKDRAGKAMKKSTALSFLKEYRHRGLYKVATACAEETQQRAVEITPEFKEFIVSDGIDLL
jgi:hypothetical protein